MTLSPSCVSGISACHFTSRRALNFSSRADHLQILTGRTLRNHENSLHCWSPRCRHAHSCESFLGILLLDGETWPPLFLISYSSTCLSKHLTLWKFQSIAFEPEILWKRWFASNCLSISWVLFLLLCHSHMNLIIQNSWPRGLSTWQFSTGNNFLVKWLTNPRPWGWPQFF